jgi:hypothetical protein
MALIFADGIAGKTENSRFICVHLCSSVDHYSIFDLREVHKGGQDAHPTRVLSFISVPHILAMCSISLLKELGTPPKKVKHPQKPIAKYRLG